MNIAEIYFIKKRKQLERITHFKFLFTFLSVVILLIIIVFLVAMSRSRIVDPPLEIIPHTTEERLELKPKQVRTGLIIRNFGEFDMVKNDFTINAIVWFNFNPKEVDQEIISQFEFQDAKIINKSAAFEQIEDDRALIYYSLQIKCTGNFNYRYFPFDLHRLNLILINPNTASGKLMYITNDQSLSLVNTASLNGWINIGQSTENGHLIVPMGANNELKYEASVFSISFKNGSLKHMLVIFLPFFLIFFVGLLSLTFDVMTPLTVIFTLSAGSTTALIFFGDALRKLSPSTEIFTTADAVYVILLVIIITSLILQIYTMHYFQSKSSITQLQEILDETILSLNIVRCLFFLFFLVVMLGIVTYLLVF